MTSAALALAMAAMLAPHRPDAGERARLRIIAAQILLRAEPARLDPLLVAALIAHESGFRVRAVGLAGELGLGQLRRGTAATKGYDDASDEVLFAIPVNVTLTIAHMARVRAKCPVGTPPAEWLSLYKGIKKRRGRCPSSAYAVAIAAEADHFRKRQPLFDVAAALEDVPPRAMVVGGAP